MTKTTQEVQAFIEQGNWQGLRDLLESFPPPEIVDLLPELDEADRAILFRLLHRPIAAEIFSCLEPQEQDALLSDLTNEETRQLLANMRPDDRTHFLEEMPGQATQRLMNLLSPHDLQEARQLLGYPEDSVGRLMTPDYVAVRPYWTIDHALSHIRLKGKDSETIYTVYVVDASWKLLGTLELRKLLLADSDKMAEQIMNTSFASVMALDDREEAVKVIQKYNLVAVPVVDSNGVLLGIVTVDDVLDVSQEEVTEDFHKVGGITPLESSYRASSLWSLFSKRIGWLAALVVVNLVSSSIIASFEDVLTGTIVLAFFIPLLIDSGGNAGAQAATLMIRALATGDINVKQWGAVFFKEIGVGALLGITLGAMGFALGAFRGNTQIGWVVGLTMISIIIWSNLLGMFLPFLFTRIKLDPAVASSPLITTLADVGGLAIYFLIASWIL
ncbi:MAG: magnesium transporter [bacterium]|jgi:magnesium transporter|nr:magnesium transporter [bacterium]MDD4558865.1 magnesium transporter [bacterium]